MKPKIKNNGGSGRVRLVEEEKNSCRHQRTTEVNYFYIKGKVRTFGKLLKPSNIFSEISLYDCHLNVKSKTKAVTSCYHTVLSENPPTPKK